MKSKLANLETENMPFVVEALNFDFYEFLHFFKRLKVTNLIKFRAPKMAKKSLSEIHDSLKLISRKI